MKPYATIFITFLLMQCFTTIYAQTDSIIDFLNINNAGLKYKFKKDEKARVKIININRFIYKVNTEMTEEDFNTTVPSILSSIKLPSFLTSQMPAAGARPLGVTVNPSKTASELQTDFENKLKDLIINRNDINDAIDKHNSIVHISKNCEKDFTTIEAEVKNVLATYVGAATTASIPTIADSMQNYLSGKIELANNIVNDMEELFKAWESTALSNNRGGQITDDDRLVTLNSELKTLEG